MQDQIKQDLKQAQLDRDELTTSVLRMLLSELSYLRIQKGQELGDKDIIAVVSKEVKKRKEAAAGFRQGLREEAAQKEEAEAQILKSFLPAQLSDEELTKIVEGAINESGAKSMSDMGRVIGLVMGKVGQQADGGRVSGLVKAKLQ